MSTRSELIARETTCLELEDRLAVDAVVAGDQARLERMGERELVAACQKEAYQLDPASFVKRRRQAEADRNVTCRPAPDAMVRVSVLAAAARRDDDVTRWERLSNPAEPAEPAGISLGLVMTDQALFGTSDEPVHLHGYGAIPGELAREMVAGACSRDERVWLRRL